MARIVLSKRSVLHDEEWAEAKVSGARQAPVEPGTESERRLMAELIRQAMIEATFGPSIVRDEARAWLSEAPAFSARECFEALGVDYEAARAKLQAKWATLDAARKARCALRR